MHMCDIECINAIELKGSNPRLLLLLLLVLPFSIRRALQPAVQVHLL